MNPKFHKHRAKLEEDPRLTHVRKLDPFSKSSSSKRFYAQGMVDRFDAHYTKKTATKAALAAPAKQSEAA